MKNWFQALLKELREPYCPWRRIKERISPAWYQCLSLCYCQERKMLCWQRHRQLGQKSMSVYRDEAPWRWRYEVREKAGISIAGVGIEHAKLSSRRIKDLPTKHTIIFKQVMYALIKNGITVGRDDSAGKGALP